MDRPAFRPYRGGAALLALLVLLVTTARAQVIDDYRAGIAAAKAKKWVEAEQKLKAAYARAQREGRRQGREVVESQAREFLLPDLYLAEVYAETGRVKEAEAALARVGGLVSSGNGKDYPQLQRITQVVAGKVKEAFVNAGRVGGGPVTNPGPATSTVAPDPPPPERPPANDPAAEEAARRRAEFATFMQQAQGHLTVRRYSDARVKATSARDLNVDNASANELIRNVDFEELLARAESALQAKQYADARAAAGKARALNVDAGRVDALLGKIGDGERAGAAEALVARLAQVESQIAAKRFAAARASLKEAEGLGADRATIADRTGRINIAEAEDAVARALRASDAIAGRSAIDRLRTLDARNAKLAGFDRERAALETGDQQRLGLLAFYRGDYRETVRVLQPLAAGAGAPARVHLYLASSNAALSFFGGADAATLLQTARDQYRKARPQAAELAPDLRFISPRILRVLQGS